MSHPRSYEELSNQLYHSDKECYPFVWINVSHFHMKTKDIRDNHDRLRDIKCLI